jgi:hypothetical protein
MQNTQKPKPPLTAGRAIRNVGVAVTTLAGVGAAATLGAGAAAFSGLSTLATGLGAISTGIGFIPGVGALATTASATFGVLAGPVISAVGTLGMGMAAPAVIGAAMVVGATFLARGIFKAVGRMIDKAMPAKAPATPSSSTSPKAPPQRGQQRSTEANLENARPINRTLPTPGTTPSISGQGQGARPYRS